MTKYIEVVDTAFFEQCDTNLSFIVAVREEEYESLKNELDYILSNQEEFDSVYEAMMDCINKYDAEQICPDFILEW